MSQDVAARLAALTQDHREGRLTVTAYRSLRAPLLDMLVTPEPVASAEPESDPSTTTRPRHRPPLADVLRAPAAAPAPAQPSELGGAEQPGPTTPADSLVEASALAHANLQAAARAEQRSSAAIAIGIAVVMIVAGLIGVALMRSEREPTAAAAVAQVPAKPDSNITESASGKALTPMPPPLPAEAKRKSAPSSAAVPAADSTGCGLRASSSAATPCRDRLSATEFGPRMLLLAGSASHSVAFAISARPISQAQFRTFCQRTSRPYPRQPWSDDDDPVVNVTWDEAREYLAWLSATTGKRYRLATESEWLYFASQGKIETRYRNGNVREWMQDTVDDRNSNSEEFSAVLDSETTEAADAADANDREFQRVIRGVSYADPTADLLTARRVRNAATRDALTGFRALREVP